MDRRGAKRTAACGTVAFVCGVLLLAHAFKKGADDAGFGSTIVGLEADATHRTTGAVETQEVDAEAFQDEQAPREVMKRNRVLEYPRCAKENRAGKEYHEQDEGTNADVESIRERAVKQLESAVTLTKPFESATYFCNLWSKYVYLNLYV